jgi:hypothetical protein
MKLEDALGFAPEQLSLPLREMLTGRWVALELYDPQRLPLRKILAIATTPAQCFAALKAQGLDLTQYEVIQLPAAF